jgi:lipopolysaccharide/colanic/teichoic acid biosynthesis glycosyltransferase
LQKRIFDIVIGSLLAVLVLPTVVILAVGCAIALRTTPFFVQTRIGRDGRPFRFVKLRTLPRETPAYASKYEIAAMPVPSFTRRLRGLHLDELPQLFLVPLGKMSLVGPRPEMPELHHLMDPTFAAERTKLRPGCTGLWQIGAHNHRLISEAPEFDRFYLEHRTLRLDAWIVLRSLGALLPGEHRIDLHHVPAWTGAASAVARAEAAPLRLETVPMIDHDATSDRVATAGVEV